MLYNDVPEINGVFLSNHEIESVFPAEWCPESPEISALQAIHDPQESKNELVNILELI